MDLVYRFLLGGAIVSAFAVIGESWKPKTFSGLFGAAPSVAIATLALAYGKNTATYVAAEARSMLIGALAMFVYATACVHTAKHERVPVWLGAGLSWFVWLAVALGVFEVIA